MKVSYITWEDIFIPQQPQDLEAPNLRYVFPEWDIKYFNPKKTLNVDTITNADLIILEGGIWGGTIKDNILSALNKFNDTFVIAHLIGEWTRWITWHNPENLSSWLLQFAHPNVDLVSCNELSVRYLDSILDKPVRYLGFPYAEKYVKQFKSNNKQNIVDFRRCGGVHRWLSYSLIDNLPDKWIGRLHLTSDNNELKLLGQITSSKQWDFASITGNWEQYLRQLSNCKIMIAVDNRFTIGRFCMDAAALGIPCISGNQHSAQRLFPELICEPYNIKQQELVLDKLINDNTFYQSTIETADDNLGFYSFDNAKNLYIKTLEEFDLL